MLSRLTDAEQNAGRLLRITGNDLTHETRAEKALNRRAALLAAEAGSQKPDLILAAKDFLRAVDERRGGYKGPRCGHSACSQNWIDTGDAACYQGVNL